MSDTAEKKEISISEQIERTSVNITTFSALNDATGLPVNLPIILGGEDLIEDEVAKLEVEEAFGQLNIQSLFGITTENLESCLYDTFHVGEHEGKLTPHVYLLKSHQNSVYLLNLLTTPYADLNLDSYFNEVEFMSRSFSGVFRRTLAQLEEDIIDDDRQDDILKTTVDNLAGYIHYMIFTERGLRELVAGAFSKVTMMVLGMFMELSVRNDEYVCLGDCGKTFETDNVLFEEKDKVQTECPECKGKLAMAPPIVVPDNIQFTFPPGAGKILGEEDPSEAVPAKFLGYFTSIAMPRNISLTVNRLSPQHFSTLATIPSKATFVTDIESGEYVSLNTNWRPMGDGRVFIFVTLGYTKFYEQNHLPFIPQLTAITVNRKITEGVQKGKKLDEILRSSIINDWRLTEKMKISALEKYANIDDLPEFGGNSE
ncbi:MAG: zinc ribbon domain-containing protein [Candidatus Heimdallarchaeota archaeon]|nr:zinc ribbon domain-containing protein [Candidatus Heimdallarchaeota archaeon]